MIWFGWASRFGVSGVLVCGVVSTDLSVLVVALLVCCVADLFWRRVGIAVGLWDGWLINSVGVAPRGLLFGCVWCLCLFMLVCFVVCLGLICVDCVVCLCRLGCW